MYEIDYSDTESSQTSGNVEKLNKTVDENQSQQDHEPSEHHDDDKIASFSSSKRYVREHYMESNSDNELDDLDFQSYQRSKGNLKSLKMNQIIDDYKLEVAAINHGITSKPIVPTTQLNNLRSSYQITDSKGNRINPPINPVIKKYLKAKDQEIPSGNELHFNSNSSMSTSNRKINDLSKKSKNLKDMTKPSSLASKHSNNNNGGTNGRSALVNPHHHHHRTSGSKKPLKSPSTSLYGHQQTNRQDSVLDEFQIEKVVSWMSVNEDNFSELDFGVISGGCSNAVVNINDTRNDKNGKDLVEKSKDETTYQEIVSFIKEIEHDGKDNENFKALKTDVEFKLNTILNSMNDAENEMSLDCTDTVENGNNKLK